MEFKPNLKIGNEYTNADIVKTFICGNMGGMRRSKKTNTLVIISDDTKGLYSDVWKDGILHYTGMGKKGDQVLKGNQNATLYHSDTNGIAVHLFEVMKKAKYTYRGLMELAEKPYISQQADEYSNMRNVWIFPLKPAGLADNCIENPLEKEIIKLSDKELIRRSERSDSSKKMQKTETTVYYRDPYLKELVKRIASGHCQFCREEAPFIDMNGEPYLEEHHVKRLADGGNDTIDNVVAICPNCHRKIHVLNQPEDNIMLEGIAEQNKRQYDLLKAYDKLRSKK